jgi:pilus assembly protein Flp/PilA
MKKIQMMLTRLAKEDSGQDLIEYALLAAFISLACIVAMTGLATAISAKYDSVGAKLTAAVPAP